MKSKSVLKLKTKALLFSILSISYIAAYASTTDCTDGSDGNKPTCIIFITPHDHDGDFNGVAIDGYDGANKYCNQEAQSSDVSVEVKNLYNSGIRFRAFLGGNPYGSTYPNTTYYWPDQTTKIATTDQNANFPATLTNPIGNPATSSTYWLGIDNRGENAGDNCHSYTNKYYGSGGAKHNYYGITGNFELANWSNENKMSCSASARLACIAIVYTDL